MRNTQMDRRLCPSYTRAYSFPMDISTRLDQAMQAAGIPSQSALARASGVPQPTINRILKGTGKKGPETNTIAALAAACNVSPQWLTDGSGPIQRAIDAPPTEGEVIGVSVSDETSRFVGVRVVARYIHAGIGGHAGDVEYEDHAMLSLPMAWVEEKRLHPTKLIAIRVIGDSMYPTLKKGNIVIVNTADNDTRNLMDGKLYAVNHHGRPCVKRLEYISGRWLLASDNQLPEFRSRPVDESTEIIGRVVRMEADFI
ncbi:MAG: S24 family peptidase [Massilia sp.]|uniref:XRE family transcriptional regulator n=1 Tax=Massilia sp. TaxID=1882437 RepID=UPI002FCB422F